MKKFLYGTTALAAAGLISGPALAQADPLHFELGGYFQQFFGFADMDKNNSVDPTVPGSPFSTNTSDTLSYKNAEVYFKMRGELDNGLKIGGRLELEGDNGGDQIDQAYLTLSGGFGSLRLGSINSGRYSIGWNTDAVQVGVPINSGWGSAFVAVRNNTGSRFRSPGVSTVIDQSNDEEKITYFTPRFNGFQFTASWTPEAHKITSGSIGQGGETTFSGSSDEDLYYTNALDFGLSYSGEFNGVGVEVQTGIGTSDVPSVAETAGFDDPLLWQGGLAFSYQGFSVAGGFAVVEDGIADDCAAASAAVAQVGAGTTISALFVPAAAATCPGSNEGNSFVVGVAYETGPWGVSATYFVGEEEGVRANPGDEENEFYAAAVSYTLGPGIRTSATYLHIEMDDDLPGNAGDNEGDAFVIGVHLGF